MNNEANLLIQNFASEGFYDFVVVIIVEVAEPIDDICFHEIDHAVDG